MDSQQVRDVFLEAHVPGVGDREQARGRGAPWLPKRRAATATRPATPSHVAGAQASVAERQHLLDSVVA